MNLFARWIVLAAFASIVLGVPGIGAAASIVVNGSGELIGATNVQVGSAFYDVTFVDNTCAAVFNGCDSSSDFDFTTEVDADAAASALLNQVFGSGDAFDTNPERTFGCSLPTDCVMWIPHTAIGGTRFDASVAFNLSGSTPDLRGGGGGPSSLNFGAIDNAVFADFTPAATPVPEPTSLVLLGSGALGLLAKARRRRKAAPSA